MILYSGLTWAANPPWCLATLTKGTFLSSALGCNTADVTFTFGAGAGPQVFLTNTYSPRPAAQGYTSVTVSVTASDILLTARAEGIFLAGQTMAAAVASAGSSTDNSVALVSTSISTASPPENSNINDGFPQQTLSGGDSGSALSKSTLAGVVVGAVLGSLVLLGLCFFFIWRRRKQNRQKKDSPDGQETSSDGGRHNYGHMHGNNYHGKAELDASAQATRNELEGTLAEIGGGAGIYVRKPELEGTPGMGNTDGDGYIKRKAELEALHQQVSELEAIPVSTTREDERISPIPISPGETSRPKFRRGL